MKPIKKSKGWWVEYKKLVYSIVVTIFVIFLAYIIFFPVPWKVRANEQQIYRNEKCVIVGTNENAQDFSHNKFHTPIILKVWLIKRLKDTTQFAELDSQWKDHDFYITKELWYSKGIGDTLHFDYIRKDKFFTIKK